MIFSLNAVDARALLRSIGLHIKDAFDLFVKFRVFAIGSWVDTTMLV